MHNYVYSVIGAHSMKRRRQAAILDLVDRVALSSQEDLRRKLKDQGFTVTQATLSRDLRDLGLVKASADGAYHRPGAESTPPEVAVARLQHAVAEFLVGVDRAQQLVVLKTGMAQAQPLASAVDAARIDGVVGTIGGEDTVLVICRDAAAAAAVAHRFEKLAR
jgi:transcriptional regulator of arginine metabolism